MRDKEHRETEVEEDDHDHDHEHNDHPGCQKLKKIKKSKAGPTDLTGGLVSIQGHYLYHLTCAVVIFFVTRTAEDVTCSDKNLTVGFI